MSFSHTPRLGFVIHSIPRPKRRKLRAAISLRSPLALLLVLGALGAAATACAADPADRIPAVVSQVAPAAPGADGTEAVSPDAPTPVPASITYSDRARARRRTPR